MQWYRATRKLLVWNHLVPKTYVGLRPLITGQAFAFTYVSTTRCLWPILCGALQGQTPWWPRSNFNVKKLHRKKWILAKKIKINCSLNIYLCQKGVKAVVISIDATSFTFYLLLVRPPLKVNNYPARVKDSICCSEKEFGWQLNNNRYLMKTNDCASTFVFKNVITLTHNNGIICLFFTQSCLRSWSKLVFAWGSQPPGP